MSNQDVQEYLPLLDRFVREYRDEMTSNLSELLMFQTVSGSKNPEEHRLYLNETSRGFSFLSRLAKSMGLETRNYDNRVFIIEQPAAEGSAQVIGIPLHLDVVPSGEGWHYPAFGGMIEDGVIYGRGAQDDKGPIIQMLYALQVIKRLKVPFRRAVRLIIATQEETGQWEDVDMYLQREPAPHFCIVPDARFPIINGEKGFADVRIELRWNDPLKSGSVLHFNNLRAGERSNIVPNRADIAWDAPVSQSNAISKSLKDCMQEFLRENPEADTFPLRLDIDPESQKRELTATFLGKSAHGSRPQEGHNAALDALKFLQYVPELPAPLAKAARFLHEACADIYGANLGIAAEHGFIGKTTVNLGILEMDREKVHAVLNIRPTLGLTLNEILGILKNRLGDWAAGANMTAEVQYIGKAHEPLFLNPKAHPELIHALKTAYQSVTGEEAELIAESGTTYAKAFPNALCFGPVLMSEEKSLAHQADECLTIEHLLRNTTIYATALLQLAAQL